MRHSTSHAVSPNSSPNCSAGVDEVGRGCIAGPVFAAAVVLPEAHGIEGLRDSKRLSPKRRLELAEVIKRSALSWCVGEASVEEIDRINILQATFLAMRRAVHGLAIEFTACRVDGNQDPGLGCRTELIVGGDGLDASIMAASIVAKVTRDQHMIDLDARYPGYGFAQHKGYGTAAHLGALRVSGPTPIHRMSFAPCRAANLSIGVRASGDVGAYNPIAASGN